MFLHRSEYDNLVRRADRYDQAECNAADLIDDLRFWLEQSNELSGLVWFLRHPAWGHRLADTAERELANDVISTALAMDIIRALGRGTLKELTKLRL